MTASRRRLLGIIQARMGSTRLPGKALLPFGGSTVLGTLADRLKACTSLDDLAVATSDRPDCIPIRQECERLGITCVTGSESDVLGRLHAAARTLASDAIVRITADDVLMDPAVVDFMADRFLAAHVDCLTGLTTRSFPNGFVVSVIATDALARATSLELDSFEREHVIPAFLKRRDLFKVVDVQAPVAWSAYQFGLTLDTADDYTFLMEVAARSRPGARLEELLALLAGDPQLRTRAERHGFYWEPASVGHVRHLSIH